ncbi:RbsD/FucU domain-containing protein [Labrenzia sp. CE80]|uniref:RbsD/FucU family protein n=1 Tax=Labrenzia sp. CE80 TaxID=1788986 RepID=UPI00129B923B|nr:RbsD/FucU domain-containing protein [Labrenzia sp. CE80]
MLRGLPSLLSPDLLFVLRSMGHGDEIVIVDANFPADSNSEVLVRLDGLPATEVLEAILQVMPLDTYDPTPALTMEVVGDPDNIPPVVASFQEIINRVADTPAAVSPLERFAFYDRAKKAFAIVQTGETRLYGNLILKKGVVAQ